MFKLKNGISHVASADASLASIIAFTVFPSPGYAEIEEIVVTANRRGAATLQDIIAMNTVIYLPRGIHCIE